MLTCVLTLLPQHGDPLLVLLLLARVRARRRVDTLLSKNTTPPKRSGCSQIACVRGCAFNEAGKQNENQIYYFFSSNRLGINDYNRDQHAGDDKKAYGIREGNKKMRIKIYYLRFPPFLSE